MKRILVWLLSVAMVIGLAVVPASAADALTVSGQAVGEVNMADGSFTYDVSIANNAGLIGAMVTVTWPETDLKLTANKLSDIMPDNGTAAVGENTGSFTVSLGNDTATEDYTGNGILFTLTFEVLEGATAGEKAITLAYANDEADFANFAGDDIAVTFVNGSVTLVDGEAAPAEDETKVATPVIDPNGATLKEDGDSVDITISCTTSGAAIYYQLGDADATLYTSGSAISLFTSGGAIYTSGGAVNLGTSVTLKAWAIVEGLLQSDDATAEFKIEKKSSGGGGGGSTPAETPAEDAFPFKDVPESAYFRKAVEWAWKNGITAGTTETTFSPYIGATRGQMMTYLWAAAGCPEPSSTDNPFTDVAEGAYYYKAVLWAVEKGITAGTSATTFSPDQTITRGQAITFLYGAAGRPEGGSEPFTDVNDGDYFAAPVAWAYSNGITVGISDTEFGPSEICQRCQVVQFLYLNYAE